MAQPHRILCIHKTDRQNPHERIRSVGGREGDGRRWQISLEEAIRGIKERRWLFWVQAGEYRVEVIVALHAGREYLKTTADDLQPDNLLSLPECA